MRDFPPSCFHTPPTTKIEGESECEVNENETRLRWMMSIVLIELSELIHLSIRCCCSRTMLRVRVEMLSGEIGFRETIYYFIQLLQLLFFFVVEFSMLVTTAVDRIEGKVLAFDSSILICKVSVSVLLSSQTTVNYIKVLQFQVVLTTQLVLFLT